MLISSVFSAQLSSESSIFFPLYNIFPYFSKFLLSSSLKTLFYAGPHHVGARHSHSVRVEDTSRKTAAARQASESDLSPHPPVPPILSCPADMMPAFNAPLKCPGTTAGHGSSVHAQESPSMDADGLITPSDSCVCV